MKLAFSTNAFTRFSLEHAIAEIANAGFDGVELLADVPHAYPMQIDAVLTRRTAVALEQAGIGVSNVNVNCSFGYWKDAPPEPYFEPSLISPVQRYREDRIAMIVRAMNFARDVGAKNISITSGRMLGAVSPDIAMQLFETSIRQVLDHAETIGMDVGIECEPGLFVEYVAELAEWIGSIGSARLGANLDVGHCQVIGESVPAEVERLRSRMWNLHVEGMPGKKHYHMVPGDPGDTMDWTGLRGALQHVRYDRYVTVELYTMTQNPTEAATRSYQFLDRWRKE